MDASRLKVVAREPPDAPHTRRVLFESLALVSGQVATRVSINQSIFNDEKALEQIIVGEICLFEVGLFLLG